MKAVVTYAYGSSELREIEAPALSAGGVLIRVRASSVNPVDWYGMTGRPYFARLMSGLRRPKDPMLGSDFAGTVEAVGDEVVGFRPGDEVFGMRGGSFAEYVCASKAVALKPAGLTFEQAAAVPLAATTALQSLRDKGRLEAGQKVLINGASGGVGTFAVQIAKALGAEVTAVCSTRNVELVRSLGADHVVDYTGEDFASSGQRYDLIIDNAGGRPWSACKRVLTDHGALVVVGAPTGGRMLGPVSDLLKMRLASMGSSKSVRLFLTKPNSDDLRVLSELVEAGKVAPVIDRSFQLSEVPEALDYLGQRHARGKVVISVA